MATHSKLIPGEKVAIDDPRLFNMNDLAIVLGVNRAHIRKMKCCGFKMPLGRASIKMAHDFLKANADLVETPAGVA